MNDFKRTSQFGCIELEDPVVEFIVQCEFRSGYWMPIWTSTDYNEALEMMLAEASIYEDLNYRIIDEHNMVHAITGA